MASFAERRRRFHNWLSFNTLRLAIVWKANRVLQGLISLGMDPTATDSNGNTLAKAALVNNNAFALIAVKPTIETLEGKVLGTSNFLQWAVIHGYTACVNALLMFNINRNPLDEIGKTPLDNTENAEIINLLTFAGGKTSTQLHNDRIEAERLKSEGSETAKPKVPATAQPKAANPLLALATIKNVVGDGYLALLAKPTHNSDLTTQRTEATKSSLVFKLLGV